MRKGILFLFTCLLVTATAAAQEVQTLTLQEAVDIALENNYRLRIAENNLELADGRVFGAKADFLPSVGASFGGGRNTGQQFSNIELRYVEQTAHSLRGSISAGLTIFDGFRNVLNLRRSRVGVESGEANLERMRQTVIFDAARQYLQVLVDRELLEISRQSLETARKQLDRVQAQVDVGSAPPVDLYNQQSTVANAELALIQRENAVQQSKASLVRTLQLDPMGEYELQVPDLTADDVTPREYDLRELTRQALASREDVRAQELAILSSRYDLQMARGALYPSITASASISTSYGDVYRGFVVDPGTGQQVRTVVGFGDQFLDQRIGRSFGFNISIPIFSNWNTRINIQQAEVNYRNARLNLEDRRYGVQEEVRQAWSDYYSYRQQLESSEVALVAAERNFESQEERYNVGASTLIELSDATDRYTEAQANHASALYRLIFQEKLLEYYLGSMDENISLN